MSLLAQIKQDQLAARKAKETAKAALLTTLIGEVEMVGKNDGNREVTDVEVVAMVKKFLKNVNETLKALGGIEGGIAMQYMAESQILESYLPKQFTEDQLTNILGSIKVEISAGPKDMGKMLGLLKNRFDGQYDGRLASTVAKSLIS
jgi:uncharacterized protein YqeY